MALSASDINGTKQQYIYFRKWCEDYCPSGTTGFYNQNLSRWDDVEEKAIACFSFSTDRWMLANCDINWVLSQLRKLYGS